MDVITYRCWDWPPAKHETGTSVDMASEYSTLNIPNPARNGLVNEKYILHNFKNKLIINIRRCVQRRKICMWFRCIFTRTLFSIIRNMHCTEGICLFINITFYWQAGGWHVVNNGPLQVCQTSIATVQGIYTTDFKIRLHIEYASSDSTFSKCKMCRFCFRNYILWRQLTKHVSIAFANIYTNIAKSVCISWQRCGALSHGDI